MEREPHRDVSEISLDKAEITEFGKEAMTKSVKVS